MPQNGQFDVRAIRGTRMLRSAPIDKIVAHRLLERHAGRKLPIVGFESRTTIPEDEWADWLKRDEFPIDLGKWKYHGHAGSASEFVAQKFGLKPSRAEQELVNLVNRNNKSGCLKELFASVVWLLRDLYEVGYQPIEVIDRVSRVIDAWLAVYEDDVIAHRSGKGVWDSYPQYQELRSGKTGPLTLANFFENLWRLEADRSYAEAEMDWWFVGYCKVRDEQDRGKHELPATSLHEFTAGDLACAAIRTGNKFIIRAATKLYDLVVVMNPDGHAAIMSNGKDLTGLANELERREPTACWHWQRNQGVLVNGGLIYRGAPATSLAYMELVKLVQTHPPTKHQRVPTSS
ncbi:MAG: hypothetical protein AAB923_03755 [Patescibacteria group bacterium]